MIRIDDPYSPDGNNGEARYEMFRISKAEVEEAWREVTREHLLPSRLITLGFGFELPTEVEQNHLEECESCRSYYHAYSESPNASDEESQRAFLLPPSRTLQFDEQCSESEPPQSSANETEPLTEVPLALKDYLYVSGPILFPNQEVTFHSWQFGRLITLAREHETLAQTLVDLIAQKTFVLIKSRVCGKSAIVCFGNAMHRCGVRLATICEANGLALPHVVLAHDYYSPSFVCDPGEFNDATVFVLVDVVHTGQLLQRILEACRELSPRELIAIAVIDQTDGTDSVNLTHSLWTEQREVRLSLEEFRERSTSADFDRLQRFEPNDECGVTHDPVDFPLNCPRTIDGQLARIESELLDHIHTTGALKRDHTICGKRYPYVVNVLDLLKKETAAREFILEAARAELRDLISKKVCVTYNLARASRAGVIAKAISSEMQWPVLPIGRSGSAFSVTDKQYQKLKCYKTVIVADAAIRTGETTAAMAHALSDGWFRQHTQIIAFFILDALSDHSREDLSSKFGLEIRTLFQLPMSPPTEEIRHWTNSQKMLVLHELKLDRRFENVQRALGNYCDPPAGVPRLSKTAPSMSHTSQRLKDAVSDAQLRNNGKARVYTACRDSRPQLIRHLSLNEVVHDHSVQDLLIGVMYNSMKPSFKESAALALAAARNYDWMTLEWIQCNRPFLTSPTNSWKAVLLIECEMRLNERKKELDQFRSAAIAARRSYEKAGPRKTAADQRFLEFPADDNGQTTLSRQASSHEEELHYRLIGRLDTYIEAAG